MTADKIKSYEPLTRDDFHAIMGLYRDRHHYSGRDTHDLLSPYKATVFEPLHFDWLVNISLQNARLNASIAIADDVYDEDVKDEFYASFDGGLEYYGRPIVVLSRFEENAGTISQLVKDDGLKRQDVKNILTDSLGMNDPQSPFYQALMSRTLVLAYMNTAQIVVDRCDNEYAQTLQQYPFTGVPKNLNKIAHETLGYLDCTIPREGEKSYRKYEA